MNSRQVDELLSELSQHNQYMENIVECLVEIVKDLYKLKEAVETMADDSED